MVAGRLTGETLAYWSYGINGDYQIFLVNADDGAAPNAQQSLRG